MVHNMHVVMVLKGECGPQHAWSHGPEGVCGPQHACSHGPEVGVWSTACM